MATLSCARGNAELGQWRGWHWARGEAGTVRTVTLSCARGDDQMVRLALCAR